MFPGLNVPQIYTTHNEKMTKGSTFLSSTYVLSQGPMHIMETVFT